MRRIVVSLGVFWLVTVCAGVAQEPTAPAPSAFEVASVKPNTSRTTSVTLPEFRGNTFRYANLPPLYLLMQAYGMWSEEVIGVPAWLKTERFDVVATAPAGTSFQQALLMVRHLFETRFSLRAHRESMELPVHVLTIANANGELGSQLRRAEGCLPRVMCDGSRFSDSNASYAIFKGTQWPTVVERIAAALDHRLLDRTGLSGAFDVDLRFVRNLSVDAKGADGVDIFAAVRQQLGLKLEQVRAPVEVLVIDSIERPTPD